MKLFATALATLMLSLAAVSSGRAQDMPESSPQALAHYAKGIEQYVGGAYTQAVEHLYKAFEEDATFYVALFMAGVAHGNAGRPAQADSLYTIVAQHKDRLSPYYRERLEATLAARAGDMASAIETTRRTAREAPGTKAAYNLALFIAARGRPGEAREALRTLDPAREPMRGWYGYFEVYGQAAHALGDYEDELRSARQGRSLFPTDIRAADDETLALAAMGRLAELDRVLDEVVKMAPIGASDPGAVMVSAGQEVAAHGRTTDAKRYFERAVAWYDGLPAEQQNARLRRANRAYALYNLGRYREAAALYEALAREFPGISVHQVQAGMLAALTGDRARASEVARRVEAGEVQGPAPTRAIWRGLIAAALGEREKAVGLFRESGVRPRWMHRDPLLRATITGRPEFAAYLKPEG